MASAKDLGIYNKPLSYVEDVWSFVKKYSEYESEMVVL